MPAVLVNVTESQTVQLSPGEYVRVEKGQTVLVPEGVATVLVARRCAKLVDVPPQVDDSIPPQNGEVTLFPQSALDEVADRIKSATPTEE